MMKYSFNTWAYSYYPHWVPSYPLKDTIERLARMGYDGIEIGASAPHAWPYYLDSAKRKEIFRWLKDNGIACSSMLPCFGGYGPNIASDCKEEREWSVQHSKDILDLAAELAAPILLFVGGWYVFGSKKEDAWKYSLDGLMKIASYAQQYDIKIAVEPTPSDSNLIESIDDALLLMRKAKQQAGVDNIGVMFDTAHAFYRNEPLSDAIYTAGADMIHCHIADRDRQAPGTRGGDFVPVMQAFKDIDYQGYVTMENGFANRGDDPDSIARLSLEHLKALESQLR